MYRDFVVECEVRRIAIRNMLEEAKAAHGLLGTTIQWGDVQDIAGFKFGEEKEIKPLAEGVGLQSLLGIAEVDWSSEDTPFPNKFALKIGSPVALLQALKAQESKLPSKDLAEKIADEFIRFLPPCHNSEIYFYNYIKSLPNQLAILPDYYFGREIELLRDGHYSKGCIAIEYVENVKTMSPLENFSDEQMLQVLDSLAELETQFLGMSEDQKRKAPHRGLAGLYSTFKDWFLQLNNGLMAQFPDPEMQKLAQKFAETLPEIISADDLDLAPVKLGMKRIFVHGDMWSANMMWDNEGNLKKLIDFQMIHFGLAATDLARVFNTCLTPENRHEHKDRYMEHYYKCLEKHCKKAEQQVPFDLDQVG
ncbi:unnamed protein product [Caenorhabditis brenneri]